MSDNAQAKKFTAALNRIGWTQAEFCRHTGMNAVTVNRWSKGKQPPSPIVWAYLDLREKVTEAAK